MEKLAKIMPLQNKFSQYDDHFLQREKKINLPQVSDYFKIVFLCSFSEVAIYINLKRGFELF